MGGFYLGRQRLTIAGEPQTMATAAEYLAAIEIRAGMFRRVLRCGCRSGPCDKRPDQDLPGGEWSHCPLYVLRSPWWRSVVALWQQHALCGSIDADNLAAWATYGVITLRERIRRQKNDNRSK